MEVLMGIFITAMGLLMLLKPKVMWKIGDSWKVNGTASPTELYLNLIHIGGSILIVGGICAILQM